MTTDPAQATSRRFLALFALVLMAVLVIAYADITSHDFVTFDDRDYVTENAYVRDGFSWDGVRWAFTTRWAANWHPLTWLSHMLDCQLFDLHAPAHCHTLAPTPTNR